MKKIIIISCVLMLLLCPALAADHTQKELDALIWISKATGYGILLDEPAWSTQEWYAYWLENFSLSGDYEPCKDAVSMEEETALSETAYRDWAENCGITNENDFSEASMLHFYTHTDNGVKRELALVQRLHGETGLSDEQDFYTLIDRADKSIIARSDVKAYRKFQRHAEEWKKEREALRETLIPLAKETVAAQFSKHEIPTTLETLADYEAEITVDNDVYWVHLMPQGECVAEFTVTIPKDGGKPQIEEWNGTYYPRYTQAELERVLKAYDEITAEYEQTVAQAGNLSRLSEQQRKALTDSILEKLTADGELGFWFDVVSAKEGIPVWADQRLWEAGQPTEKDITENAAIDNAITDISVLCYDQMPEALEDVEFAAYYTVGGIWQVMGARNGQEVFRVDLNSVTTKPLYAAQFVNGEWRDLLYGISGEGLERVLGPFGEWSILEKYRYGIFYNGVPAYGFPDETEMQPDEALQYAKEQLVKAYPELTMEMLDAADVCPYFYIAYAEPLYGRVYDRDIYYFSMDVDPAQGRGLLIYEIIFDAKDGTVHVLHDPDTSGNG